MTQALRITGPRSGRAQSAAPVLASARYGKQAHNVTASRDQILAMTEPAR
jgi:hypothetical protein